MNKTVIALSVLAIAAAAGIAIYVAGDGPEPAALNPMEKAIKDRQANFKTLGGIMKSIDQQTKSDDPDQGKIADAANRLVAIGAGIPTWFPAGSGPEAGIATHAKPEIWTDNAHFLRQQEEFMIEARKLATIAATGTMAETTTQYYTTGVACANCHKPFREKME
jgi:cytochrome c556